MLTEYNQLVEPTISALLGSIVTNMKQEFPSFAEINMESNQPN